MEHQIVYLKVAMYQHPSILWLILDLGEELHKIIKMRKQAHQLSSLLILRCSLRLRQTVKRLNLPIIKPRRLPKRHQPDILRPHSMQLRQRPDSILPHLSSMLGAHVGERRINDHSSVQELHDVELCADDAFIFAHADGAGDGDVGLFKGVDDAVLAIDSMCCL